MTELLLDTCDWVEILMAATSPRATENAAHEMRMNKRCRKAIPEHVQISQTPTHDHGSEEGENRNEIKTRKGPTRLCDDQINMSEGLPGTREIANAFSNFPGNSSVCGVERVGHSDRETRWETRLGIAYNSQSGGTCR